MIEIHIGGRYIYLRCTHLLRFLTLKLYWNSGPIREEKRKKEKGGKGNKRRGEFKRELIRTLRRNLKDIFMIFEETNTKD